MRNLINRKDRGFTLIELLVVIAIIGILAAVVLVSLNSARAKSRDARRLADVRQAMTALELFYNDQGGYPDMPNPTVVEGFGIASTSGWALANVGTIYMQKMPIAPLPFDAPACTAVQNSYTYESDAPNTDYALTFCLGGNAGGFLSGVHTASSAGLQ